jgi:hypothetical protein
MTETRIYFSPYQRSFIVKNIHIHQDIRCVQDSNDGGSLYWLFNTTRTDCMHGQKWCSVIGVPPSVEPQILLRMCRDWTAFCPERFLSIGYQRKFSNQFSIAQHCVRKEQVPCLWTSCQHFTSTEKYTLCWVRTVQHCTVQTGTVENVKAQFKWH